MNLSDSVVIKLSRDSKKPAPELLLSWNLQASTFHLRKLKFLSYITKEINELMNVRKNALVLGLLLT